MNKNKQMIKFGADNIQISGPRIDGSYKVTFTTGEYQRDKILEVMKMELPVYVIVQNEEDNSNSPQ